MNRRQFLASSAATLAVGSARGQTVAPPATTKKVAAVVTTYHRYSHADNIVTRLMEGWAIVGKSYPPPFKVAALFIEQVGELDIGRPIAKRWGVPVVNSIADALTLGGSTLAVDGVVIVGEHGNYPLNEMGQKEYPRRRFFEEVVKVFRAGKRSVPVFNDKHLAYDWKDAKWMYDQSKELGFPMLAGSSIPVTWRRPDLQPPVGVEWERCLSVGHGHYESYGFHTLEGLQVMTERRKGGETGVKAVQCLEGKEAWEAARDGKWDRSLLDAALETAPTRRGRLDDDKEPIVYLVEYNDGLQAAAYLSPRHFPEFAFAGKAKGKSAPDACYYYLPKPQRDHFSFLTSHAAQMILTGKAPYPVERTLLTGGMLDFLIESRFKNHARIETPELKVVYSV